MTAPRCVVPAQLRAHAQVVATARHADGLAGYGRDMSQLGDHRPEQPELEGVPDEEQISPADAAERVDADPEEQENRRDPVWDDDAHED
jgi:hypothetical protein